MTKESNPQPKKLEKHEPQVANRPASNWIIPLIVAMFVAGTFYWATRHNEPAPQPAASTAPSANAPGDPLATPADAPAVTPDTIPSYFSSAEAAKPYPPTLPPEQFPNPIIARAYSVARQIPGTLAQQPCYCFCYRTAGHRGLLDCYADLHGSACSICIQEALLTEKLQKEGRSASQIREAIIRGDWRTVELN